MTLYSKGLGFIEVINPQVKCNECKALIPAEEYAYGHDCEA